MKISMNLRRLALLAGAALLSTGAMAMPAEETIVTETETVKYSACLTQALNEAVADTGNTLLLALHQQRHPSYKIAGLAKEKTPEAETFASR